MREGGRGYRDRRKKDGEGKKSHGCGSTFPEGGWKKERGSSFPEKQGPSEGGKEIPRKSSASLRGTPPVPEVGRSAWRSAEGEPPTQPEGERHGVGKGSRRLRGAEPRMRCREGEKHRHTSRKARTKEKTREGTGRNSGK